MKRQILKMGRSAFLRFSALALCLASMAAFPADPIKVNTAGSGKPDITAQLGNGAFVPMETKRLTGARILWVNWSLLEEMGIKVPPGGLTPQFEEQLLKTFAYAVPQPSDPTSAFTGASKTFYADKYGGTGIGDSLGSGRAAGAGSFQIKGIGRTPLAEPLHSRSIFSILSFLGTYGHQHGGMPFKEAVTEAIWGDVLHAELPHGANRVAFVLSTGTTTKWMWPFTEPRALIVRENSIRPAHLMSNGKLSQNAVSSKPDQDRRAEIALNLRTILAPSPEEKGQKLTENQILTLRLKEMIARWGRQYGSQYAKSLLHSSITPSNLQLDGKMLDYGTMTSLDGYPRAYVGRGINGELGHLENDVVHAFLQDFRNLLPDGMISAVPVDDAAFKILRDGFVNQVNREFLWLAGVPPEVADSLAKTSQGTNLALRLAEIAKAGNQNLIALTYGIPRNPETYDLEKILNVLVSGDGKNAATLESRLVKTGLDANLTKKLVAEYFAFLPVLRREVAAHDVTETALGEYQTQAVALRNRKLTGLYRGLGLLGRIKEKINEFSKTDDPTVIRDFIDTNIRDHLRTFSETPPFALVLDERTSPDKKTRVRRIFNATSGKTLVTVEANIPAAAKTNTVSVRLNDEIPIRATVVAVEGGRARIELSDRPLDGLEIEIQLGRRTPVSLNLQEDSVPRRNLIRRCWDPFARLITGRS